MARRVIWLGFVCNLLAVTTIVAGGLLFAAHFWDAQDAYQRILGYAPHLLVASFLAYLVGELTNSSYVLAKMKVATNGRHLWSRIIGSTLVGQGLDTLVFTLIAFAGVIPPRRCSWPSSPADSPRAPTRLWLPPSPTSS